jgi:Xaa-Pro aminopeptidase
MNGTDPPSPAEQTLLAHLEGLREHPPAATADLVDAVMRTARWQAVVRPYLLTGGALASTVAVGLGMLVGDGPRRS